MANPAVRFLFSRRNSTKIFSCLFQVFWRIDTQAATAGFNHSDADIVFQITKLFQHFCLFQYACRPTGEFKQRLFAISIDTNMSENKRFGKQVSFEGDQRATEIKRIPHFVANNLYLIGIARIITGTKFFSSRKPPSLFHL